MEKERVVKILSTLRRPSVYFLAILLILDGVTTYIGLSQPGFIETNPLIVFMAEHIGIFWTVLLTKSVALAALTGHELLLTRNEHRSPLMANIMGHIVFTPLIALYVFIVQNNITLLIS